MPRNPKDKTTEHPVQLLIMEYLATQGHFIWRNNTGVANYGGRRVFFGKKGGSDILGCHKGSGKLIAIEVKRPDGSRPATEEQRTFLREVDRCGGLAGIAMDLEDVAIILSGKGSSTIPG